MSVVFLFPSFAARTRHIGRTQEAYLGCHTFAGDSLLQFQICCNFHLSLHLPTPFQTLILQRQGQFTCLCSLMCERGGSMHVGSMHEGMTSETFITNSCFFGRTKASSPARPNTRLCKAYSSYFLVVTFHPQRLLLLAASPWLVCAAQP